MMMWFNGQNTYEFVRELIRKKVVSLKHISTNYQFADFLTKSLVNAVLIKILKCLIFVDKL